MAVSAPKSSQTASAVGAADAAREMMIGRSPVMVASREKLSRAAAAESNVLLTGESGTGKELAAGLIHALSARSPQPFVAINCAAIPDSLLESELFGFERGAFTGANRQEPGKICLARGGTLFLDEIGDMTPFAQAKMLRAIETRQIQRLGGRCSIDVDVRFVAATNRALEELAERREFRADLYYRLAVIEIELPPLRERREDLPSLIAHYVDEFNRRFRMHVSGVCDELLPRLCGYRWPGNVRELKNVLEASFVNGPEDVITERDLPPRFRNKLDAVHEAPPPSCERARLLEVLAATRWNKSQAAKEMKWSRVTLYKKLARYRLTEPPS
jgi:transcriptional regulator with PAS, ATPase and Fis domain